MSERRKIGDVEIQKQTVEEFTTWWILYRGGDCWIQVDASLAGALWDTAERYKALQEMARLADEWCHMRLCPCCHEEWRCMDECTYRTDCQEDFAEYEQERGWAEPIRKAIDRARELGGLKP